jgi:hypothetical protein
MSEEQVTQSRSVALTQQAAAVNANRSVFVPARRVSAVRPKYRVTCPVRNKDMHRAKTTRQDLKILFL